MADDVVVDLLMRVKGDAEIRDLKKAIAELTTELEAAVLEQKSLDDAMKNPAIREATAALKAMEDELGRLTAERKRAAEAARAAAAAEEAALKAEAEAAKQVGDAFDQMVEEIISDSEKADAATQRIPGGLRKTRRAVEEEVSLLSGRMAMGFNQLAQGLEDMQYSVGGAMNNIGSAVMMFGGPAGLVAGATLAGIAINQLAKHWDGFRESLGKMSWDSIGQGLTDMAAHLNAVSEGTDKTVQNLTAMAKAADEAREKVVELATAQGLTAAGAAKSQADIDAGKVFGEAMKGALKPGQVGEDAIRAMSNLIGQRTGMDSAAAMEAVRERFGRAMAGNRGDMEFFRDYGRTAERGTLPRELADAITKGMAEAAEKERVKKLSPEQKKVEDAVDKLQLAMNTSAEKWADAAKEHLERATPSQRTAINLAAGRDPLLEDKVAIEIERIQADERRKAADKMQQELKQLDERRMREGVRAWTEAGTMAKGDVKGEREREKADREKQAAADERLRERDRMAQQALRDPRIKAEVEAAFARGGTTEQIAPRVGRFLAQQGLAPAADAPFVGGEVVGEVRKDLNRRQAGYVAEGMDKIEAFARVQGEILAEFARMDQRLMQMDQSLMRQQGIMQGHRQTRLNRGEGF